MFRCLALAVLATHFTLTPAERSLRARLAIETRWAREADRKAATAKARAGLLARFEAEVDPEGKLAPAERRERAERLRKAAMLKMSLRSAQVRRARKEAGK